MKTESFAASSLGETSSDARKIIFFVEKSVNYDINCALFHVKS